MTRVGAAGLVAAVVGALALPVAILVVVRTAGEVDGDMRYLPLAPALVLLVGGAVLSLAGRRKRPRRRVDRSAQ